MQKILRPVIMCSSRPHYSTPALSTSPRSFSSKRLPESVKRTTPIALTCHTQLMYQGKFVMVHR